MRNGSPRDGVQRPYAVVGLLTSWLVEHHGAGRDASNTGVARRNFEPPVIIVSPFVGQFARRPRETSESDNTHRVMATGKKSSGLHEYA